MWLSENSYKVALFLYGPQDRHLKMNSDKMLMGYKHYCGSFSALLLDKMNSQHPNNSEQAYLSLSPKHFSQHWKPAKHKCRSHIEAGRKEDCTSKSLKENNLTFPPHNTVMLLSPKRDMIKYFLFFPSDIYGKWMFVFSHSLRAGHCQNSLAVVWTLLPLLTVNLSDKATHSYPGSQENVPHLQLEFTEKVTKEVPGTLESN